MRGMHREQVDFLKKRIYRGDNGKQLLRKFAAKWSLSPKTYDRRVAIARAEIASEPMQWVPVDTPLAVEANQNEDALFTQKLVADSNQNGGDFFAQKQNENVHQFSTGGQAENENDFFTQNVKEKEAPKSIRNFTQKSKLRGSKNKAAGKVRAAVQRLFCTPAADIKMDDCLMMLSRFAKGGYSRAKLLRHRRRMVEVAETPQFSERVIALVAIVNYGEARALAEAKAAKYKCKSVGIEGKRVAEVMRKAG